MAILKPSTTSSKQQRNKAPVAKKYRGKSKLKKQLRFSEVSESHAADCCEADLFQRRHEIWYSREEYTEFHKDRFQTIQRFRASGGDVADSQCVRGLEPFWTPQGHRELQGNRKLHTSTVMLEQARQNLTQVREADRFRAMIAPQSDLALKRAQELAALDELEANKVYDPELGQTGTFPPSHPVLSSMSLPQTKYTKNLSPKSTMAFVPESPAMPSLSLLGPYQIRALQEQNARRLMELYSCNDGTSAPVFRFPIRRDSLVGGARFIHAMMIHGNNSDS